MATVRDYKKEFKDLYMPKIRPALIEVPEMFFAAVEGKGDPNEADGEYSAAMGILYSIQYTIKMSKMGGNVPPGYFDYVVPPLEGLWWFENNEKSFPADKSLFNWISMIRLPEFVDKNIFKWACAEAAQKKNNYTAKAKFMKFKEGLCVQCMHIGPYDDEPRTIKLIDDFIENNGLANDINDKRRHHEIYMGDPRKVAPKKQKTILRIPVKNKI